VLSGASPTEGGCGFRRLFVERFVIKQNIEHYRALLEITTDLERRGVFEKLLLEEEAKLKKYDDEHKKK